MSHQNCTVEYGGTTLAHLALMNGNSSAAWATVETDFAHLAYAERTAYDGWVTNASERLDMTDSTVTPAQGCVPIVLSDETT